MERLETTTPTQQSTCLLERPNRITTPISDYLWDSQIDQPDTSSLDNYLNLQEIARQAIESLTDSQPGRTFRCFRNQPLWPHRVSEPRLTRRQIRKQQTRHQVNNEL